MTQAFRKTLLAGVIAALLATPVFSAGEVTRAGGAIRRFFPLLM
jgi:hypothetical protein